MEPNSAPYVFVKRGIYYFSRRVPTDLNDHYGKLEGPWYTYRENSKLEFKRDYKKSLLHGIWEEYDEEGNLTKTLTYKDEEVVRVG